MRCIALVAVGLALAGCDPSPACDEGQRSELGSCVVLKKDGGVDDNDGAVLAGNVDAGPSCTPGPGHYDGFGDACKNDGDCSSCIAPTCATSPLNICSRLNCQTDAKACPPGWQCADVSAFSSDPSATHICLKM